jgi:WD40 repeat protein
MAVPQKITQHKDFGRREMLFCLARVPDSDRVFIGASDGKVYDVDLAAEKPEWKELETHTSYVTGLALAGGSLVSGSYDCSLVWRSVETGEIIRRNESAHARWIRQLATSPDGQKIASVGDDMVCRLWDAASGEAIRELRGHDEQTPNHFPSMLYTCAFSPDGVHLATADRVGRICVWKMETGELLKTLDAPGFYTWDAKQRIHSTGGIRSLAFSPDGKTLAAGGIGHIGNIDHLDGPARVELFAWECGEKQHEFLGDAKGLVERLIFGPEGDWLLGVGGDNGGLLQLYSPAEKKVVRSDKAPMHVHSAVLNESADTLYTVGHGKVVVYKLEA